MWIVAIEPIRIRAASIKLCDWLNDGRKPCRQQFFAHLCCQEYYPFVLVRGGSDFGCWNGNLEFKKIFTWAEILKFGWNLLTIDELKWSVSALCLRLPVNRPLTEWNAFAGDPGTFLFDGVVKMEVLPWAVDSNGVAIEAIESIETRDDWLSARLA